jgi:hypothetical protein
MKPEVPWGRLKIGLKWLIVASAFVSTWLHRLNRPDGTILLSSFCPAMNRRAILMYGPFGASRLIKLALMPPRGEGRPFIPPAELGGILAPFYKLMFRVDYHTDSTTNSVSVLTKDLGLYPLKTRMDV